MRVPMSKKEKPFLEEDEFCIQLRFSGEALEPDEITRLLGLPPTGAHRKGDTVSLPNPSNSYTAKEGYWAISTERSTRDIEEQLTDLFAQLTPDLDVWGSLTKRYKAYLFCGVFLSWFGHGFSMSSTLHRALSERNLLITFDIYPEYDQSTQQQRSKQRRGEAESLTAPSD
jgi:Domain of unknown function (DUF4279)